MDRDARETLLRGFRDLLKVPIGRAFRKFPEMAHVTAVKLGKQVHLEMIGGDLEIDKELENILSAPMTHIIRNSVDHGISEAIGLIFHPGFSSKEEATDLSGRGGGMDVVKTEIEKCGGLVEVESEPLKGSTIILKVPAYIRGK